MKIHTEFYDFTLSNSFVTSDSVIKITFRQTDRKPCEIDYICARMNSCEINNVTTLDRLPPFLEHNLSCFVLTLGIPT